MTVHYAPTASALRRGAARAVALGLLARMVPALLAASTATAQPSAPGPEANATPATSESATSESVTSESGATDTPPAEVQAHYRTLAADAVREYQAGHWAEARALFLAAHRLWPSARTFRTLGMTAFELRDYPRALGELTSALSDSRRPLSAALRLEVQALVTRTRVFVGTFKMALSPTTTELLIDGEPARLEALPGGATVVRLSVGRHEVLARASEHIASRRVLMVQGGDERTLHITLAPVSGSGGPKADAPGRSSGRKTPDLAATGLSPPEASQGETPAQASDAITGPLESERPGRLWTWVAAGSAAALALASGGLWLASDAAYSDLAERCDQRPSGDPCRPGNLPSTRALTGWEQAHRVTLGLSLVAAAAAGVLYFLEVADPPSGLRPGHGGAQLSMRF